MPRNSSAKAIKLNQKNRFVITTILLMVLGTAAISSFAAGGTSRYSTSFKASDAQVQKGATKTNGIITFSDKTTTTTTTIANPNPTFETFNRNDYLAGNSPATKINDPFTQGAFRTNCQPSHLAYVDPIAKFNQNGASHLHMFFGNRNTSYNSTAESIKNTGMGSCDGGPLNRSAYWIPAMMQNSTSVVLPFHSVFYYKTEYNQFDKVQPMPDGLRMISGDGMAHQVQTNSDLVRYKFKCNNISDTAVIYDESRLIGNCPSNSILDLNFSFPQCWDGRLDSPDHKSHLTYSDWGARDCPASHPILLPQVSLNMRWYTGNTSTANWYLSSDDMSSTGMGKMPGGTTIHADWFMGWDTAVKTTWHANCLKKVLSCNAGQLGDGTTLKHAPLDYQGPLVVQPPASLTETRVLANSGLGG